MTNNKPVRGAFVTAIAVIAIVFGMSLVVAGLITGATAALIGGGLGILAGTAVFATTRRGR